MKSQLYSDMTICMETIPSHVEDWQLKPYVNSVYQYLLSLHVNNWVLVYQLMVLHENVYENRHFSLYV